MTLAMAGFAVEDLMIVKASREVPTGQILVTLGSGGAVIFALMLWRSGLTVVSRDLLHPSVMLRNASEAAVAVCIVLGLSMTPLSVFASVLQALPLAVTLGAALFLGEPVGWRRWTALIVGFGGVLTILQPGTAAFEPSALLAVASVALLASRDLATRRLPERVLSLQVACWGFAAIVPAGGLLLAVSGRSPVMPSAGAWAALAAALAFGTLAYLAIVRAVRMAETSVVAPFRYTRLVVAMVLAVLVLGERPGVTTLGGAAVIIASGLYTVLREARVRRATA
jgi:drug/metabolite transporter (DMT)-like permease